MDCLQKMPAAAREIEHVPVSFPLALGAVVGVAVVVGDGDDLLGRRAQAVRRAGLKSLK